MDLGVETYKHYVARCSHENRCKHNQGELDNVQIVARGALHREAARYVATNFHWNIVIVWNVLENGAVLLAAATTMISHNEARYLRS